MTQSKKLKPLSDLINVTQVPPSAMSSERMKMALEYAYGEIDMDEVASRLGRQHRYATAMICHAWRAYMRGDYK